MEFCQYEPMPNNIAEPLIAKFRGQAAAAQ
jgi:hypothetical protein